MSGQDRDEAPRCAQCDSDDLEYLEGEDFTGVEMDGYRERRLWQGYKCRSCGWSDEF